MLSQREIVKGPCAAEAATRGWEGYQFLAGVPGTLGGAVAMNAGVRELSTWDRVRAVEGFRDFLRALRTGTQEDNPRKAGDKVKVKVKSGEKTIEADCNGCLVWPAAVAPAQVHIVAAGRGAGKGGSVAIDHVDTALGLGAQLAAAGLDVIVDDRPGLSVGVRLTDAELIGAPWIVVVGRRLAEGFVEVRRRSGGESEDVPLGEVIARANQWVGAE